MSRTPESIRDWYNGAETVAETDGHEVLQDGDGDYWIGRKSESSGMEEEYTLVSGFRMESFTSMLLEAGLLEYAEPSEEAESADVTPVTEVADLSPGQRVTVTDTDGQSFTGALQQVRFNHTISDNAFTVHFQDRAEKHAVRVEPAEEEDESRSPEDVAETWYLAEDSNGHVGYIPRQGVEIRPNENILGKSELDGYDLLYSETPDKWVIGDGCKKWAFVSLETVDASDLPFSEVPVDE